MCEDKADIVNELLFKSTSSNIFNDMTVADFFVPS